MESDTIACPQCGALIPLSRALATRITSEARKQSAAEQSEREAALRTEFAQTLMAERELAAATAKRDLEMKLRDLEAANDEKGKKLDEAQRTELVLRRQQRELEEGKKQLELEVARRLDEERRTIDKAAEARTIESHRLKDREKDEQLASLKRTIEELNRKADQGSQQAQGEAAELEMEELLSGAFPNDRIEPVRKGARGADIVHRVCGATGVSCGTIIWELKHAKNWSDEWLVKLRADQRDQKAELAVLVAVTLPGGGVGFSMVDGVWVCHVSSALPLSHALRSQLIAVSSANAATEGRATKTELVYAYLAGTEFRQRVEALAEAFTAMEEDLSRERVAMERAWSKRRKQLEKALISIAGLYGDVQGIVGRSLPDITGLAFPASDAPVQLGP
jgi:hypothetical protein